MFEVTVSQPLDRFVKRDSYTPMYGTHIFPLIYFGKERPNDPNDYLKVFFEAFIDGNRVSITKGGGVFLQRGDDTKLKTSDEVVFVLNKVMCELAFVGVVSQPVTGTDVQHSVRIRDHIAIAGGGGSHAERTWGPLSLLASEPYSMSPKNIWWTPNFNWFVRPIDISPISGFEITSRLESISSSIPRLIVATNYHMSKGNSAEMLLSSWIVCEQLIDFYWNQYIGKYQMERKNRLKDTRTYSVAVRLEILETAGVFSLELTELLHDVRRIRNGLAHRAVSNAYDMLAASQALRNILTFAGVSSDLIVRSGVSGGNLNWKGI